MCTHFKKICIWNCHSYSKFIRETSIFLGCTSPFFLEKLPKIPNFRGFFFSQIILGGYLNNHCNVCTHFQKIYIWPSIPNLSLKLPSFWLHSSIFALNKKPKNPNFHSFLSVKESPVATFIETRPPTSRKYVSEPGMIIASLSEKTSIFLVALLRFWFSRTN